MKKIIILAGFLGILTSATTSVFAGYFDTTPAPRCNTQISSTLQIGSENNDVIVLQNLLSASGYLYVNANGYFGPSTNAAVKRFQNANGLSATGIVGEATRNAINERLCDTDVLAESNNYGYANGVTYVDQYDPYAIVISPRSTTPAVYSTPQDNNLSFSSAIVASNAIVSPSYPPVTSNYSNYQNVSGIAPASTQVQSTNVIYNSTVGYTYGIVPKSGSLTINSPVINSSYNEGDTVNLVWTTNNIDAHGFQILLENTSTGQSKQVMVTNNTSASFVLSKEILDTISNNNYNYNYNGQESFRIVIATPITDIAGNISTFRAAVSPIVIKRPFSYSAAVSVSTGKDPVDSGEKFRLYVNTPAFNALNASLRDTVSVRIHAVCVNNVQVSIAGVPCGQDFVMPLSVLASQSGIPTMITNVTWFKQVVAFEVTLTTQAGQIIGTAHTTVSANAAPFNW